MFSIMQHCYIKCFPTYVHSYTALYAQNFVMCPYVVCYAPLNGQVDCGSGLVNMGLEGDNCTLISCDPGYMLQGSVTSGTCENNGNWSEGLPSRKPLNCSGDNLTVPASATVLQLGLSQICRHNLKHNRLT